MMGETVQITDIKYPEDGYGIFTHLDHYKYPYKGYPDEKIVEKNAILKRCVLSTIKLLVKNLPLLFLSPLLFLFPFYQRKIFEIFAGWVSELYGTAFRSHFPADKRLCPSGRELNRVGELLLVGIKPDGRYRKFQDFLRTILLIWEFDNSYRYRGQDVFSLLDRSELLEHPRREILRIFKVGLSRERAGLSAKDKGFLKKEGVSFFDTNMKWELIILLLRVLLFVSPAFVKLVKRFLSELNTDKIKLDEGDWYWVCERCDYDFGGKSFTERFLERLRQDEEYFKALSPTPPPQAQIAMIPNDEFYFLEKPQAENVINGLLKQMWEGYEKKRKADGLV